MGGPLNVEHAQWATKVLVLGVKHAKNAQPRPFNSRKVQLSVHRARVVFTKIQAPMRQRAAFLAPWADIQYCRCHWKKLVGNTTVLCVLPDSTQMWIKVVNAMLALKVFRRRHQTLLPANRVKQECIETLFVLLERRVKRVAPNVLQDSMQTQQRQQCAKRVPKDGVGETAMMLTLATYVKREV